MSRPSWSDVVGDVIRSAAATWRSWVVVTLPAALVISAASTLSAIQEARLGPALMPWELVQGSLALIAVAGTLILAGVVLWPPAFAAVVHFAVETGGGRAPEDVDVTDAALDHGPRAIGLVLLAGLIATLPLYLALFIGALGFFVSAFLIGAAIVLVLTLPFAVIVTVRLALSVPVLVSEGAGVVDAMRRSNERVRSNVGFVMGVGVAVVVLAQVIAIPLAVLTLAPGPVGFASGFVGQVVVTVIGIGLYGFTAGRLYTALQPVPEPDPAAAELGDGGVDRARG